MNDADQPTTTNDDSDHDFGRALALPSDWSNQRDAVLAVDRAQHHLEPGLTADYQPVLDLRDLLFDEIRTHWSPPFPFLLLWPPSWYLPVDTDWRIFGALYNQPPNSNRYARDWTASADPASRASRRDGTLAAYIASRPDEDYRKQEAGVGISYSPTFELGTVRVVPEIICSGVLRTRLEMFSKLVAGSVRVSASVVVAQWEVIPNGFDLVRHYTVPVATTYWVDQSHGPNWNTFNATPAASEFSQQFLVERQKRYLFGIIARVETWSTLRNPHTGAKIPRFDGNVFNLWGQHNALVPRIKVTTVNRYMP